MKECEHAWSIAKTKGTTVRYRCTKCLLWDNVWVREQPPPVEVLERLAEGLKNLRTATVPMLGYVELGKMTIPNLLTYARDNQVGVGSKMRKGEIIAAILRARS